MKLAGSSAIAALFLSTPLLAADLYQPDIPQAPYIEPQVVPVASSGGWYLRGDGFYAWNKLRGANYFQGSNSSLVDFTTSGIKDSYGLGGGVGYQMNSMLRADLTADYMFSSDFRGATKGSCGAGAACTSTDIAKFNAISIMANAYVDLGTYYSITPYLGAGIGGTHINWSNLSNTSCSDTTGVCDATETHDGRSSWRFTYALMAGASVDLTCNLKADVGYRYRHVAAGDMFGYKSNGGPGYDKGMDIHEGRVGLRYAFGNNCQQPMAYVPPPVEPIIYK